MKKALCSKILFNVSILPKNFIRNFFLLKDVNSSSTNCVYIDTLRFKTNKYSNLQIFTNATNGQGVKYIYKPENILKDVNSLTCFFLRKSKNFNKGRYSRNRQVYRTGVYMCFYINIAALYGLWFYYYKFKFKFSYFWWFFILLPFSFVNARALKYNLYLPKEFLLQLSSYLNWFFYIFKK